MIARLRRLLAAGTGPIFALSAVGCHAPAVTSLHLFALEPIRYQLNPWSLRYAADYLIVTSLWRPFSELDENKEWSFPFCDSWSFSERDKAWTFEISPGLRWSDGSPMSAADIRDSLVESVRAGQGTAVAEVVQSVELTAPQRLVIRFKSLTSQMVWLFAMLDQSVLDASARARIREGGEIPLDASLPRTSGRFRLKSIGQGRVLLEPNPYFPAKAGRAALPVEVVGNLSLDQLEARLLKRVPGSLARIAAATLPEATLAKLREAGFQELDQPVPTGLSWLSFGRRASSSTSRQDRHYLFAAVARGMLGSPRATSIPALGWAAPSMLGALDLGAWKSILDDAPPRPRRRLKLEVFVMRSLRGSPLYTAAKQVLDSLPVDFTEVVYDAARPESREWKRRVAEDYDLLFAYQEEDYPDPDLRWRDLARYSRVASAAVRPGMLSRALSEPDSKKRALLYQTLERRIAEDPVGIPLQRFGDKLFVDPALQVGEHEEFTFTLDLSRFKQRPR